MSTLIPSGASLLTLPGSPGSTLFSLDSGLLSLPVTSTPAPAVADVFSVPMLPGETAAGGTFEAPTVTTPSFAGERLLRPNFSTLASGKDPYRAWVCAVLDGIAYFANGWDQAWYADVSGSAFWPLGSVAPTSFVVADAAAGATFPLGMTLKYYLVFRDENRGEETAPQTTNNSGGTRVAGVSHTMVAAKNALITWNAAEATARFPFVAIYRQRQNDSGFVLVALVASSAGTYTDSTADTALSTSVLNFYVDRFRLDLPPVFKSIAAHQGRLFGVTGIDANLSFGQQAIPINQLVQTDFPVENVKPIEPDDGFGEITAIVAHYDTLLVFKRRACYVLEGDDPDNWSVRRMFADRGCIGARCVVSVLASLVFLDEAGLFAWAASGEPVVVGAKSGVAASPLAPLWLGRMNLDAADMMHLVHNETLGYVEAWVALDNAPQARHRVRWNYRNDRYESVDDGMVSHAAGTLNDGAKMQYACRAEDLGLLWQDGVGSSDGVASGTVVAEVDGGSGRDVICSAAAFATDVLTGPFGCTLDRIDEDGVVLDENRVASVTSATALRALRWSSEAVAIGQTAAVGSIRDYWELPFFDFGTGDWKSISRLIVETEIEAAGALRIDTTGDERDYVFRREVPLSDDVGWAYVPAWDRCYTWKCRGSSRYAGWGYSTRALRADWRASRKGR